MSLLLFGSVILFGQSAQLGAKSADVVKISAGASKPDGEGKQTILVTLEIAPSYHIYANPVKNESFKSVQTVIRVHSVAKLRGVMVAYPVGKTVTAASESFRVYEGKVTFKVSIVRSKEDSNPVEISAWVQATNAERNCLPSVLKVKVP